MKRALFFPSYFGNGFGHVARCLAVAGEMSRREWAVGMVLAGPHAKPVQDAGYKVFKPFFPKFPRSFGSVRADYTYIADGSMQVLRDGFVRPWRIFAAIAEAVHAVKTFRPDVLVGDMSLLTWLIGKKTGIPVVQIIQAIVHPESRGVIWWEDVPKGIQSPDIRPVFASVLKRLNLPDISRAEDLLQGDQFLIPGIPEIDPLPGDLPDTHYIGALLYTPYDTGKLRITLGGQKRQPTIYVTHGGGHGRHYDRRFFNMVNDALGNTSWSVIYSMGRSMTAHDHVKPAQNISCHQWLPNGEIMEQSDVVVFHGGYTTMMETVYYGVPSVVLPTQSEQEGNGRRLKARSAAYVLPPSPMPSPQRVEGRWHYGDFAALIKKDSMITPDMLKTAVESVLTDGTFRRAAQDLRILARKHTGAAEAVDLIDNFLR